MLKGVPGPNPRFQEIPRSTATSRVKLTKGGVVIDRCGVPFATGQMQARTSNASMSNYSSSTMTRRATPSRNAIGYVRVSTRNQADRGVSLSAQTEKIKAFCAIRDLELTEIIDDAGQSAKTLKRPGMERLLSLVKCRQVGAVIVAKLDRISRSVRDLADLVELFQNKGVEFASVSDSIDTSTAAGRLVLNVIGSVSQWEREAIAERTSEALVQMRREGRRMSRFAPFGFRYEGTVMVADKRQQGAITTIFSLHSRGLSLRKIAAELEAQGVTSRNGTALSSQTIWKVLQRDSSQREGKTST